jgi:hypothetical protein
VHDLHTVDDGVWEVRHLNLLHPAQCSLPACITLARRVQHPTWRC